MANSEHVERLLRGADEWNEWRSRTNEGPDLSGSELPRKHELRGFDLRGSNLSGVQWIGVRITDSDLRDVDLRGSNLEDAFVVASVLSGRAKWMCCRRATFINCEIIDADFEEAFLRDVEMLQCRVQKCVFIRATLSGAELTKSRFEDVDFRWSYLEDINFTYSAMYRCDFQTAGARGANFTRAHIADSIFRGTNIEYATFGSTTLVNSRIEKCWIHGISAWDIKSFNGVESELFITHGSGTGSHIAVDSLEIAQFLYLLLANDRIRKMIDTVTTKVVLILGRFTAERKDLLDALREELRRRDLVPVIFDFEQPAARDTVETVSAIAHLSRFIIADVSEPRSVPQELQVIAQNLLSVPIQPVIVQGQQVYGMFDHIARYPQVLAPFEYRDRQHLLASLDVNIIAPAQARAEELKARTT